MQNTQVGQRGRLGKDVSLSRQPQCTAGIFTSPSNVRAHRRRENGKERGGERQREPAAEKGSGRSKRQTDRDQGTHQKQWGEGERENQRTDRKEQTEREAHRKKDTGRRGEREKRSQWNRRRNKKQLGFDQTENENHRLLGSTCASGPRCPGYTEAQVTEAPHQPGRG